VKLRDALDAISTNGRTSHVYSEPYQTADGATVIAVANVRGKVRPANADSLEAAEEIAVRAKPVGVFVIHGGGVKWSPAVDPTPIALLGVLTGLIAATLATLAMVRRPPWPDIRLVGPLKALDVRRVRTV
jgi:hypothetical protein